MTRASQTPKRIQRKRTLSLDDVLEAVPTNWCDSLLTGPHAVIGKYPSVSGHRTPPKRYS